MPDDDVQFTAVASIDEYDALARAAKADRRAVSRLVQRYVREGLERERWIAPMTKSVPQ